jgi:hypothetical protein
VPPKRTIPLEPVGPAPESTLFTDVVLAYLFDDQPFHEDQNGSVAYETDLVTEAAATAFALGCALGAASPGKVPLILEQTHPGEVEEIITECAPPLQEQAALARNGEAELGPELFLGALFETVAEGEPIESDAAYNMASIGFEYGCILALVERSAAQLLRNSYNRHQSIGDANPTPAPMPVQDVASRLLAAYEDDPGLQ